MLRIIIIIRGNTLCRATCCVDCVLLRISILIGLNTVSVFGRLLDFQSSGDLPVLKTTIMEEDHEAVLYPRTFAHFKRTTVPGLSAGTVYAFINL